MRQRPRTSHHETLPQGRGEAAMSRRAPSRAAIALALAAVAELLRRLLPRSATVYASDEAYDMRECVVVACRPRHNSAPRAGHGAREGRTRQVIAWLSAQGGTTQRVRALDRSRASRVASAAPQSMTRCWGPQEALPAWHVHCFALVTWCRNAALADSFQRRLRALGSRRANGAERRYPRPRSRRTVAWR